VADRSDAALVEAARAGDRAAFGEIYDRYADRVYGLCRTVVRRPEDAADATQDTFVRAAERLEQLRDPSRLRPWLFSIARNEALQRIRRTAREDLDQGEGEGPAALATLAAEAEAVEQLSANELRDLVWDASAGLDERDRVVLDLYVRQGLEGAELGEAMGVTTDHAYQLTRRVRTRIDAALGALLIARLGRKDCPDLQALLAGWDGTYTPAVRRQVVRHVDSCDACQTNRGALVSPAALFATIPLLPVPLVLKAEVLAAVEAAGLLGGTAAATAAAGAGAAAAGTAGTGGGAAAAGTAGTGGGAAAAGTAGTGGGAGGASGGAGSSEGGAGAGVVAGGLAAVVALVVAVGIAYAALDDGGSPSARSAVADSVTESGEAGSSPAVTAPGATTRPTSPPASTAPTSTTAPPAPPSTALPVAAPSPDLVVPPPTAPATPPVVPTTAPPTTVAPTTTTTIAVTTTTTPPPAPPVRVQVSPGVVDFGGAGTSATITLANVGAAPLTVTATASDARVGVAPGSGTVPAGGSLGLTVTLDRAALPPGPFAAAVNLRLGSLTVPVAVRATTPPG
jgi:RNA polymerase sigma factor (sigma-70 family)